MGEGMKVRFQGISELLAAEFPELEVETGFANIDGQPFEVTASIKGPAKRVIEFNQRAQELGLMTEGSEF